ncbi:sugar phosphate isomerase/epimerase family protein [Mangrovicoccus algicola]|uniref:Sugar phosphate isomerase/epimerase n=1 Tax=Mangrovicoccus algicola TaxID=2771008 RepID=A0A8J6Z8U2_9RHOB|nr:sugar phosphate isomerase/epimerase [Mangrovicoccus algicola]MBE3637991.1 sugar phosphate isomerase/epimerase [Mangrovicoccus algicola]
MTVSFQLYSARDAGPWDQVLTMLADLGYAQVEGFGGVYADPAGFRALLDARGLTMPSGHFFPPESFEEGLDTTLAAAKALGMSQLFCPAVPPAMRGMDAPGWQAFAKRLDAAGKKVADAGFRFGWHNHNWEFADLGGGTTAMEIILTEAPDIAWEADIAWILRGGADPLDWIARHGDRITAAHVKDIAPDGDGAEEDGWADVGHGTMDWPALMAALRGIGVELFVMEHDKPSDATRFATRSIDAFKTF